MLASNSWSSCFSLPSVGITGVLTWEHVVSFHSFSSSLTFMLSDINTIFLFFILRYVHLFVIIKGLLLYFLIDYWKYRKSWLLCIYLAHRLWKVFQSSLLFSFSLLSFHFCGCRYVPVLTHMGTRGQPWMLFLRSHSFTLLLRQCLTWPETHQFGFKLTV